MVLPVGYNPVDFMSPRIWTGVVRDIPIPQEYIGFKYLPERSVPSDKLQWDTIKAENPLAPLVAVSAESPRLDDEELTTAWADITYIKFKRTLSASDVRIVRDFGQPPANTMQANMKAAAEAKITRQAARLRRAVDARLEWMQINALLGGFAYSPNTYSNITMNINYGCQQVTANPLWTDTVNSDPLNDMTVWFQNLTFVPTTAIMSNIVFNTLARNAKLIRQFGFAQGQVAGQAATQVPPGAIQEFFSKFLGMNLILYNARYTTGVDSGTARTRVLNRFLPDNKVIFLPDVPIGYTATAPAEQNNFNTGVFAWTVDPNQPGARKDPWLYELGCGYYGLPIVELPDWVIVATVG